MNVSTAWLLNVGAERPVAIGERELLHLVPEPELFSVPLAPSHCARVLPWQGQLLPVWDLGVWLDHTATERHPGVAAIVGYQSRPGDTPQLGAIVLAKPPTRITVADSQACPLPADTPQLSTIAIACFLRDQLPIPILDIHTLFSTPLAPPPPIPALRQS